MKWEDRTLDDFAPIKLQTGVGKENSDYSMFIDILNRFNLIQQKNYQRMEELRLDASSSLERLRKPIQTMNAEKTELKSNLVSYEKAILEILDTVDNMMVIVHDGKNQELESFLKPFNKMITTVYDTLGWTIIPTQGLKADMDLHSVLHTKPASNTSQIDMIAGTIRRGYRCGDRIIRKAEIIIYT